MARTMRKNELNLEKVKKSHKSFLEIFVKNIQNTTKQFILYGSYSRKIDLSRCDNKKAIYQIGIA